MAHPRGDLFDLFPDGTGFSGSLERGGHVVFENDFVKPALEAMGYKVSSFSDLGWMRFYGIDIVLGRCVEIERDGKKELRSYLLRTALPCYG